MYNNNSLFAARNSRSGYEIDQSLRFNSADSAYLNRTPGSAGNRRTWTWSGWYKVGKPGDSNYRSLMEAFTGSSDVYCTLAHQAGQFFVNQDNGSGGVMTVYTDGVYRDPSAWYHTVFSVDTTQATATNRVKIYINGVQVPVTFSNTPSQNLDTWINGAYAHRVGARWNGPNTSSNLDGYLAEINFIDGSALTPSSFGELDPITGAWIPKRYGGSYTGNSFYLKFQSSGIGTDSSGLSNTWTANNFTTSGTGTDVMSDTPTTNWCTLNRIDRYSGTLSSFETQDGNLVIRNTDNASNAGLRGTFAVSSGKWYWEMKRDSWNINQSFGIATPTSPLTSLVRGSGGVATTIEERYIYQNGTQIENVGGTNRLDDGDIGAIALDLDNLTIRFYKNGVAIGAGNISIAAGTYAPCYGSDSAGYVSDVTTTFNFGQRAFAYTPPTGYKALNTSNLPEPTIKDGGKYFNTVLYTGNGSSTRAITGIGFSPDFVWIKSRSNNENNNLYDAVRGATNFLMSNSTSSEQANAATLKSFDSDGFTVGDAALVNWNTWTYAAWCWDAGGAGSTNTAGSITSTVSANASAGFSIVTYTGNGTNGATVGHGLGVKPKLIIEKGRGSTYNWSVQGCGELWTPATSNLFLNGTSGLNASGAYGAPTSTYFYPSVVAYANENGVANVAYCFSEVAGYSKFGSYTGNGSSDGPFVFCGFRPAFILRKSAINAADDWVIQDVLRPGYNETKYHLTSNQSNAEVTNSTETGVDILSNGFKVRSSNYKTNYSGATYIFAAFAELPFKYANAR